MYRLLVLLMLYAFVANQDLDAFEASMTNLLAMPEEHFRMVHQTEHKANWQVNNRIMIFYNLRW